MFICGCNFSLYYRGFQKKFKKILENSELKFFAVLILIAIVFVALVLYFSQPESFSGGIKDNRYYDLGNSFRYAFFQIITVCTGSGHVSADYDLWPNACRFLLILLMFIGACAGSTGGGIKCVRILLLLKSSMRELIRVLRPRMVKHVKLNGESVSEEIITESSVFFVVYLGFFGVCSLLLMALNTDIITAFSAEKAVIISVFKAINSREQTPKNPRYTTKNTELSVIISSLTDSPFSFTCFTMRGLNTRISSRMLDFSNNNILTHFIPPPVEPAHAPINISKISKNRQALGHKS